MSKANRKKVYEKLLSNDKAGRKPGLSQDDGALKKEFGKSKPLAKPLTSPLTNLLANPDGGQ